MEDRYADGFLADLLAADDPRTKGDLLQREISATILARLEQEGLYSDDITDSEYLAAYCLSWWTGFARGYRFEVAIFSELQNEGIKFAAHDLRVRAERLSPYDLIVDKRLGEIRHTTYFLHTARSLPLKCDFYITRLYDARHRRYSQIVILTQEAWEDLNGEVTAAKLETAADFFPEPVQIMFENRRFIILTFESWKERVKRRQRI